MEAVLQVVQRINFYLSDYILVFLLIGTGLYFSVRTRFVQVRCFGEGMRSVFGEFNMRGGRQKGGLSSFQALTTAIAAQVGTGNIIGACGAILLGGPGAIFWMWIIAFFGMATIYAEAVLAQETRRVAEDGSVSGGPVYYIKRAFPGRFGTFLAGFFAVALILALGFMGCMVQSNSIGESLSNATGVPTWVIGIVVAALSAYVFLGGSHRVASWAEKIVPVMACLYLIGGLVVLIARIRFVPETFGMIFRYAFQPQSIIGGSFGFGCGRKGLSVNDLCTHLCIPSCGFQVQDAPKRYFPASSSGAGVSGASAGCWGSATTFPSSIASPLSLLSSTFSASSRSNSSRRRFMAAVA